MSQRPEGRDSIQSPLGENIFFEIYVPKLGPRIDKILQEDTRIILKGGFFRDVTELLYVQETNPEKVSDDMIRAAIETLYQETISRQPNTTNRTN